VSGALWLIRELILVTVIDLLEALNITRSIKGVSKTKGLDPGIPAWKFRQRVPHLTLPRDYSIYFLTTMQDSIGIHFVAQQAKNSDGTLISFFSPAALKKDGHPLFQLVSSTRSNQLHLEYRTMQSMDPATILFPGGTPFANGKWARVALNLEAHKVTLFIDCEESIIFEKKHGEDVLSMILPIDLEITFASMPGNKASKFLGYWQTAEISPTGFLRRPWHCENLSESPIKSSKHFSDDKSDIEHYQQQQSEPDVLPRGPRPHPVNCDERIRRLEETVDNISMMLSMVKSQNTDLLARVKYLETCECRRPQCSWEGRNYDDGSRWEKDQCTACTCVNGQVQCSVNEKCTGCIYEGKRYDNGESFNFDQCVRCVCLNGNVNCIKQECIPTSCQHPIIPRNKCCPECFGCFYNGHRLRNGQSFQADQCTRCTCRVGVVKLLFSFFSGCEYEGVAYVNGAIFLSMSNPCMNCSCLNGKLSCLEIQQCPHFCTHDVKPPFGSCCRDCSNCDFQGQLIPNGISFMASGDMCKQCTCNVSKRNISQKERCVLPCRNPANPKTGSCCPFFLYLFFFTFTTQSGEVTCEHLELSCPPVTCTHPAKLTGQCCATCDSKYQITNEVLLRYFGGNVRCKEEVCPAVYCSNPVKEPHQCCASCKVCILDGVEFEEGAEWEPDEDACSICTCSNGEVICQVSQCPPLSCQHPSKSNKGDCCASCDSCMYNQRIYNNGQDFIDPDSPCQNCRCQDGTVQCIPNNCPRLHCSNPDIKSGQCCPRCPDCTFENRVFVDGEKFPNPLNPCQECICVNGHVNCENRDCPGAVCTYPMPGTCCRNNCNGCSFAGKDYVNGAEYPHPTDKCKVCHCINGNVQCFPRRCPPLLCSNPFIMPGECCPQCPAPPAECFYSGLPYKHMERFYDPVDKCRSCICNNGTITCQRKPCAPVLCTHPIVQDCCRTCDGCLYGGKEMANGEQFTDTSDPCRLCVCREGTVSCDRRSCPILDCPFPVQAQCCPACEGCNYAGQEYLNGQEFTDPQNQCKRCTCINGFVTCNPKPCYNPGCTHPISLPGKCCPVCEGMSGSIHCLKKLCPPAPCSYPVVGQCECSYCEGNIRINFFLKTTKQKLTCGTRKCTQVACPHPALDTCSCPVCDGCSFNGRNCHNGESFPDPKNKCQRCSCLNGGVTCVSVTCPAVNCRHPVKPPGECCPQCTGICHYLGNIYESGATFDSSSDSCSVCTCMNEVVTCQRKPCREQCTHPVPSSSCCPVCDRCFLDGTEFGNRQTFLSPSDSCQRCNCLNGNVVCTGVICPQTTCTSPHTIPGQCCPECLGCTYLGKQYSEGVHWISSINECLECGCVLIPWLMLLFAYPTLPGCVYNLREYLDGSSWFASTTPCMSCMCVEGVTTCSEIHCVLPCVNQIHVPGECCPVCADCVYNNHVYGPHESFQPADDPCEICTCEVMPDGEQHLRCYRKQCPSLVDCPKSHIHFPSPDQCCPTCAQPLSNCTAILLGNEIHATDDPCYTCQCKDLTWTCIHQGCPHLSCPSSEQFTPADSCCPICDECLIESENRRVSDGERWTDSVDECITCTCNLGHIECHIEECLPVICQDGLVKMKSPGKCCYECQDPNTSCIYQSTTYQSNEHWEVDECTTCTCVSGEVHCQTERCPQVTCASDETAALIPGMCCPHCIPRPATCIAFGDPHYRTFDGKMINFQGTCTYVLAEDCEGGDFSIHTTNDDKGRKGVSWIKEVTVLIGDVVVQLLQDWIVLVDYQTVTLPFLKEPYIYVERKTNTILLNTNIGVKVLWNGKSHLEVSVPGTYKGHTCGLCGNFNNYPQDDMRIRTGQIVLSEAAFGNNWKVQGENVTNVQCADGDDVDPCKEAGYRARKEGNSKCKILKSKVFERCHSVVPPEMFFASCVYDLCACGSNVDDCLCDALEAYASECREAGVILHWRSPSLCAVGCPQDRGYVFDECGPPCPKTCFNKDVPLGVIEAHCFKPCIPGCQCPAGLVEHESHCILPESCPRIIYGNI
uniref:Kielin cysteine rich BMP regulator n=1 Tax=Erpetoichthys calabaricus TaxID=27687 RepID=A0A8C4SMX2_ERPCA